MKCLAAALFLTLLCHPAEAQTPQIYLVVDYMKVPAGKEQQYEQIEGLWKKIHQVRKEAGIINDWVGCRVKRTAGPVGSYNYATVAFFGSWSKMENPYPWELLNPKLSFTAEENKLLEKTLESRDLINSEIWKLEATAVPEKWGNTGGDKADNTVTLGFMKSKNVDRQLELEKTLWTKVWRQATEEGFRWNWDLWSRTMPGGSQHSFDLVAAHLYPAGKTGQQVGDEWFAKAIGKLFPGVGVAELSRQFQESSDVREIPVLEDWTAFQSLE